MKERVPFKAFDRRKYVYRCPKCHIEIKSFYIPLSGKVVGRCRKCETNYPLDAMRTSFKE